MKKFLSLFLSVLLVLGTLTVLTALPTAAATENLIQNGDGNFKDGWSVTNGDGNLQVMNPAHLTILEDASSYYTNYSKDNVLGVNQGQFLSQNVELEVGKEYFLSVKLSSNASNQNASGKFNVFFSTPEKYTAWWTDKVYNKPWFAQKIVTTSADGVKWNTSENCQYYASGDFTEHSFTFKADELAAFNGVSAENGKYKVTFYIQCELYGWFWMLVDDVVLREVSNDIAITATKGGSVDKATATLGESVTVTATADYGNTFAGWYDSTDALVSTESTYTGVITGDLTAKFNAYNLYENGNFENGDAKGFSLNNENAGTLTVTSLPASDNAGHGSNALYVTTDNAKTNTMQYVLKTPEVTVKKNTEYVLRYSYYNTDITGQHYLTAQSAASYTNVYTFAAEFKKFSFAWQNENADSTTANLGGWTYKGNKNSNFWSTTHANVGTGIGKWVDVTFVFDTGDSSTIFANGADTGVIWFNIGSTYDDIANDIDNSPNFYIDNISLTEAALAPQTAITVSAGSNGTVKSSVKNTLSGAYYYATGGAVKGEAPATWYMLDDDNAAFAPRYSKAALSGSYTAVANEGYVFAGWYNKDGQLVSDAATTAFYTEGEYTARFEATIGSTDGGYVTANGDGTKTAHAYFGNTFDGWYDGTTLLTNNATVNEAAYASAVARFYKHNQVSDGDFTEGTGNAMLIGAGSTSALLTDADGNQFLRLTSITQSANFTSFSWPFTVEKGKKYIVSYKIREGLDAMGQPLSSADMTFRRQVRPLNDAKTDYNWIGLKFADQRSYTYGNSDNYTSDAQADLLPPGGLYLNNTSTAEGIDYFCRYAKNRADWVTYCFVLDASSLNNVDGTNDFFANGNTADLGLVLGANAGGTMVIDVDDIVISELREEYEVPANSEGGTVTIDRRASTPALPVTFTAYPDVDRNFSFGGWYGADGKLVSTDLSYTPASAVTLTPKFNMDKLGFTRVDGDSITAYAYYGNKFEGWYEGKTLKSTKKTVSVSEAAGWFPKFKNGGNLLLDGGFEEGAATGAIYDAYTDYANGSQKEVVPTYVAGSSAAFGDYCLQLTPIQQQDNGKLKSLLNVPVELSAGKTYLWKFSYAYTTGAYDPTRDYINFSVDEANANGGVPWYNGNVEYSFHSQPASSQQLVENGYAWGKVAIEADGGVAAYTNNNNFSASGEWVDMYVIFTPKNTAKHYLSLGTTADQRNIVVVDNMSLTEVELGRTPTAVKAEANGKVVSYRADEAAYISLNRRSENNEKPVSESGKVDFQNPYYSDIYASYFAEADLGYTFEGWYKDGFKISAEKELVVKSTGDGEYIAKFVLDNDKYFATAEVEKQNGVYGGYIAGETSYNEKLNGETVTFSAVAYRGNTFKGWYDKESGKLLSTKETFDYAITKNTELVAQFNVSNAFVDSGFENSTGNDSAFSKSAAVSAAFSNTGKNSVNLYAPGEAIRYSALSVDSNATYHFSFMWRGGSATVKPEYVRIYNAATNALLAENTDFSASADKLWQKAFVNFATNDATSVIFEIKYAEAGASIYLDDIALFNTANAKFSINVSLQKEGDVFPGFLASPATQQAAYGENVTVSAVGYEKNEFLGWFEDGKKVSTDLDYTFQANSYTDLTAKFTVKNIFPDSGAENTEKDVSLSHGKYTDWFVSESNYRDWNFDVVASDSLTAHTGKAIFNATHRTTTYGTTLKGLKEKTNYIFSFWWNFSQPGNFAHAIINGVETGDELARGMGGTSDGTWQQIVIPFYSGQNTEIKISFLYQAGSGACMMDDFALYESNFVGVYAAEGGSVTSDLNGGANGPAADGEVVTVTATPDAGNTFKGWYNYNNLQEVVSTSATYTFTVNGPKHIIAYFEGETAEPINYFVDGDFENNCFQGVIFSHPFWESDWCSYSIVKHGKSDTLLPISGDKMMKISAHSRNSNIFMNNLKPQTDYTLSFYWNADPGAGIDSTMLFKYLDESDDRLDQTTYKHVTGYQLNFTTTDKVHESMHDTTQIYERGDGEWTRVEMSFNSGNRTQAVLLFNMSLELGGDPGLYFDDFRLVEGNTQTSYVANGDFSDATNNKGWQGDFTTATENGNVYGVLNGEIYNSVKFDYANGYPYTVTFKAKSTDGATLHYGVSPAGAQSLYENGKNTAMSNTSLGSVALTSEWNEYSFDVAYNGYESAKLFLGAENGEVFIDDVSMKMAPTRVDVEKFTFEDDTDNTIASTTGIQYSVNEYNQQFFKISNEVSKSGNNSLMMSAKNLMPGANETEDTYHKHSLAQNWTWLYLMSGRRYSVTFWAKADNVGDEVIVETQATNESWTTDILGSKKVVAEDTEWHEYSFEFSTINLLSVPNYVTFTIRDGKQNSGNVYIDDVLISEAISSMTSESDKLYTEDISQNYFQNPSFEKADALTDAYVKSGDAFYGDKYISVKAGDKIIIPVTTKPDYDITKWLGNYTFAASVRGNSSAQGYIGVSYSPDGSDLMTNKYGETAKISVNTDGKWVRSGYNFTDYRWTNLYLVIECTAGSFDVDYISMFNQMRSFKENPQLKDTSVTFTDYKDMGSLDKGNYIGGNITGLPEGSKVVLLGTKTYEATLDAEGAYTITNIENGDYKMFLATDAEYMTLWGELKVTDDGLSGLACERLSGEATKVSAQGVRNGIAKITNDGTGWSYLTATNGNGEFTAYVLGDNCYIAGTTKVADVLSQYKLSSEDFVVKTASKKSTPAFTSVSGESSPLNSDRSIPLYAVLTVMLTAAALIVLTFKKGECK